MNTDHAKIAPAASQRIRRFFAPVNLLAFVLLFSIQAGASRNLDSGPGEQDLIARYMEIKSQFLELYNEVRSSLSPDILAPAVALYDIAQDRARNGYYESAIQAGYRAISQLRSIIIQNTPPDFHGPIDQYEELEETTNRQYERLREVLIEAERVLAGTVSESAMRLLQEAYRNAEAARESIRLRLWRQALNETRRATQLATDAMRSAREEGLPTEDAPGRLDDLLQEMNRILAETRDSLTSNANPEAHRVLLEADRMAAIAREHARNGNGLAAVRHANRAIELARLAQRILHGGEKVSVATVHEELLRLSNLIQRAEERASVIPLPAANTLLNTARDLRDSAASLIQPGPGSIPQTGEALRMIRQATELTLRALQMLSPAGEPAARKALEEFRNRHLPRVEEALRQNPSPEAADLLSRARDFAQQAENHLNSGQPSPALNSLRVATELLFQALRIATATPHSP